MTALDALLGTVSVDGALIELGSGLNFTGGAAVIRNPVTGKIDVPLTTSAGGTAVAIPAPALVATSNIALTGVVVIDGVASNTVTGDILATAQTAPAENGYWTPAAGAWTRPSYYDADADVASLQGLASGAALLGTVNRGQTYYQLLGSLLAASKTWVPTKAPAEINANEAPWFITADGTSQSDKFDLLLAYAATFPTGCTIRLGRGTFRVSRSLILPRYVNLRGAGMVVSEIQNDPSLAPFDTVLLQAPLNVGANTAQVISDLRVTNNGINSGTPKWAASSGAVPLNGYRRAALAHSHVMKLTTKSGNTGIANPLGELTPYSSAKMLGTALVDGQFLLKFITFGQLGTMQFQLSVNAGTTWSATQNTTAGDYNDFVVDTVMATGTVYGPTCKVRISNAPAIAAYTATAGAFTMPAVTVSGSVVGEVTITLSSGSTAGLSALAGGQQGWIYHSTAGLMRVVSVTNATQFIAENVGASSAAAPAAAIAAGGTIITVLPPSPRVEVIGTPPVNNYLVDLLPAPGPLGRVKSYYYGAASVAEATKHKLGTALAIAEGGYPAGGIDTVAGAYHDHAIPATSLTIRVHTGILSTSGSWTYFSPAAGWSMQEGTTVADGANVWTIHRGPACVRLDGAGHVTLRDVWLSGGSFNLVISQSEVVSIEGNCVLESSGTAQVWMTNGDGRFGETPEFTNNIQIDGSIAGFGDGYGIVHDGGFGFMLGGGYASQSAPSGWIFLAGLRGGEITARYLESVGQGKTRNAMCFGRGTAGTSANGIDFGGSYFGSVTATSVLDLYNSDGLTFTGVEWGGTSTGLTGCATCTNLNIIGGQHLQNKPIVDANPISGFLSCQGFELAIGTDERPPASLAMVNGANVASSTTTRSDFDISGPTAVFSSGGFVAGRHGQRLKIRNRVAFAWTINHEDAGATAANRIKTPAGAAVTVPPGGTAEFEYSTTDSRWVLTGVSLVCSPLRVATGTTDAIVAADLQANVQYTNAAGCAITLNTMPAGFSCLVSAETAAALTFVNGTATLETAIAGSGATTGQYQTRYLFWRTATNVRIT
jgi:hypothetical protein